MLPFKIVYFNVLEFCLFGKLKFKTIFYLFPWIITRNNLNNDFSFPVMLFVDAKIRHIDNALCRMAAGQSHFTVQKAIEGVWDCPVAFFKGFFHTSLDGGSAFYLGNMLDIMILKVFLYQ